MSDDDRSAIVQGLRDRVSRRRVLRSSGAALTAGLVGAAGCTGSGGGQGGDGGSGGSSDGDSGSSGSSGGSSGATMKPVNEGLTLWHAMGGGLGETLNSIGKRFQDETGVTINMEFQDSYENVLTKFLGALESGKVPDFAQIDSLFAAQVLGTGKVEPVENFLSDEFPTDDFLPNVTNFFTVDGTLQSLPFNNSNAIMYYNKTAFENAGLDPESPPATIAEVEEVSRTLVDEGVVDSGITWPNHVWFPEHWFSNAGQLLFDKKNGHAGQPSTLLTDNDTAQSLYEWWRRMAKDDLFSNPGIEAWGEATSTFLSENAAMLLTSTAFVKGASQGAEKNGFEVDNAFYPTVGEKRVGPVIGGASFFVPKGMPESRRSDIQAFLEFMSTPETQKQWHKGTGYYPIRKKAVSQLRSDGWFEKNPMFTTALDQLQQSKDDPATKRMLVGPARQSQVTIQDTSVEIFSEKVSVDQGLSKMKSQVESHLESYYG